MAKNRHYIVLACPCVFFLKCAVLVRDAVMHARPLPLSLTYGPAGPSQSPRRVRAGASSDGVANGPAWVGMVVLDGCY